MAVKPGAPPSDRKDVRRIALTLFCALSIPALAGCGSSSSGAPTGSTETPVGAPAPRLVNDSRALVLQPDDLGPDFAVVPRQTRRISLSHELKNESVRAKAADRRSYLGGYTATFASHAAIVVSEALTYRSATDAGVVFSDRAALAYALQEIHGRSVHVPSGYPGDHHLMMLGRIHAGGGELPAAFYGWRDGRHIEGILVVGPNIGRADALQLARVQRAHEPQTAG
jgi:hypothetical protein